MRLLKIVLSGVLVTITLIVCFFLTMILLSYLYDMDQALLTF